MSTKELLQDKRYKILKLQIILVDANDKETGHVVTIIIVCHKILYKQIKSYFAWDDEHNKQFGMVFRQKYRSTVEPLYKVHPICSKMFCVCTL